MYDAPLMNRSTELLVSSFIKNPVSSLGLSGPDNSAKLKVAKYLCRETLKIKPNEFDFLVSVINGNDGSIDDIRDVKKKLSIKHLAREGAFGGAIIFEDFHKMSIPAQNSALKLIEEPALGTLLILLSDSKTGVLPTISSRLYWIEVKPLAFKTLEKEYNQHDKGLISQAYILSGGHAGTFEEILLDENNSLKLAIEDAKKILKLKKYERISSLDLVLNAQSYSQAEFLTAMQKIYYILLRKDIKNGVNNKKKTLYGLDQINQAKEAIIKYNPNPKLIFTNLFYKI